MGSTLCAQVGAQGCVLHNPPPPPPTHRKGTNIVLWTEEQELELERLFEEFRGSDGEWVPRGGMCGGGPTPCQTSPPHCPLPTDILGNIMRNLTARRSRARVVEKLLALGLVAERRELHKKRRRKSCGPQTVMGGGSRGLQSRGAVPLPLLPRAPNPPLPPQYPNVTVHAG